MLKEFGGDPKLALMAYNRGPGKTREWLRNGGDIPQETQNYVAKILGSQQEGKQLSPARQQGYTATRNKVAELVQIQYAEKLSQYVQNTPAPEVRAQIAALEAGGDKRGADSLRQILNDHTAARQKEIKARDDQALLDFPWDEYQATTSSTERHILAEKYLVNNNVSYERRQKFLEDLGKDTNREDVARRINEGLTQGKPFDLQELTAMGVRPHDLRDYVTELKALGMYDAGEVGKEGAGLIKNFQTEVRALAQILDPEHPDSMHAQINNILAVEIRQAGLELDNPLADKVIRERLAAMNADNKLIQSIVYDHKLRRHETMAEAKNRLAEEKITNQLTNRGFNPAHEYNRTLMRQAQAEGIDIDAVIRQRTRELPPHLQGLAQERGLPLFLQARARLNAEPYWQAEFNTLAPEDQAKWLSRLMDELEKPEINPDYQPWRTRTGFRAKTNDEYYHTF
jgi:hypothetical protein